MLFLNEWLEDDRLPGKIVFNEDPYQHLPIHWHRNLELCYFLQGGFPSLVGNRRRFVQDGDLILVNSNEIHCHGDGPVGEHCGLLLVANMDFWSGFCPELSRLEFDLELCPRQIPALKEQMHALYSASLACQNGEEPGAGWERLRIYSQICGVYYTLTKYFSRYRQEGAGHQAVSGNSGIREIIQYINDRYTEPLTLQDIAEHFAISREYLSRMFRKQLGMTVKEYLCSVRLTHAYQLLTHTDKSTIEIAMESGFPDLRALNREFKAMYHTTPKEYQREIRA